MSTFFIILLLLIGFFLFLLEIFIFPGGVIGVLGLGAVGLSVYQVFLQYGSMAGWLTILALFILISILLIWALKTKKWKYFSLETAITKQVNVLENTLKHGEEGVAITRLTPIGKAQFGEQVCEVYAFIGVIDAQSKIRIKEISQNKITVERI